MPTLEADSAAIFLPPVHAAIRAFGGVRPLADALGKPHQRILDWARPHAIGGFDGEFPSPAIIRQVLECAANRNIELRSNDLLFGREVPHDEPDTGWIPKAEWWRKMQTRTSK